MRRPRANRFEFRRSSPLFMLLAVVTIAAAFDTAFIGAVLPYRGIGVGVLFLTLVGPLYAVARGTRVDGSTRRVVRWWGFVPKPILRHQTDFSEYRSVEVTRRYSFSRGDGGGRWVRHPVRLTRHGGGTVTLFVCTWHEDAMELGADLANLIGIPLVDRSTETQHPG